MNWEERLNAAEQYGRFNFDDWIQSSEWASCAVGENAYTEPIYGPFDHDLSSLGVAFMKSVRENNIPDAIDVYQQILDRVKEISV